MPHLIAAFGPRSLLVPVLVVLALVAAPLRADPSLARFFGTFSGSAEVEIYDGTTARRDMSVTIGPGAEGNFILKWSTTTWRDGRGKQKSYAIEFAATDRAGVFAAGMRRNVFGHAVPLDPMKGEPYIWARITGDTLTVFSLFVQENGGYEMQQFDRTLAPGGLALDFSRSGTGIPTRSLSTFLARQ